MAFVSRARLSASLERDMMSGQLSVIVYPWDCVFGGMTPLKDEGVSWR